MANESPHHDVLERDGIDTPVLVSREEAGFWLNFIGKTLF